jgi:fluoride exporter
MPNPFTSSALVGLGGFTGSIARYGLSILFQRFSFDWPFGTMTANFMGCFIIGVISAVAERTEMLSPGARLLLATGFCGGFTTMSSMVYESMQMLRSGEYLHGGLYIGVTLAGSMLAFIVGAFGVRMLIMSAGE